MGVFSWLDCKDNKPVKCGKVVNSYILIPAEFGGGSIKETCYNGYGIFGGVDVYEVVAEWNREKLTDSLINKLTSCKAPQPENYCNVWYYDRAIARHKYNMQMLDDFRKGLEDDEMIAKYGEDYLREVGILIACDNKDNKSLAYPIKITHDAGAIYEACKPSKRDPNQGCD